LGGSIPAAFLIILFFLQSTHMAAVTFGSIVDEQAVYLTAGAVLPAVIQEVLHSLLNDDFKTAYNTILKVCDESWTCFTIVRCNIDFLPFTF
jgi:hypothetical protein